MFTKRFFFSLLICCGAVAAESPLKSEFKSASLLTLNDVPAGTTMFLGSDGQETLCLFQTATKTVALFAMGTLAYCPEKNLSIDLKPLSTTDTQDLGYSKDGFSSVNHHLGGADDDPGHVFEKLFLRKTQATREWIVWTTSRNYWGLTFDPDNNSWIYEIHRTNSYAKFGADATIQALPLPGHDKHEGTFIVKNGNIIDLSDNTVSFEDSASSRTLTAYVGTRKNRESLLAAMTGTIKADITLSDEGHGGFFSIDFIRLHK